MGQISDVVDAGTLSLKETPRIKYPFENMDIGQAFKTTGIKRGTIKVAISRARKSLGADRQYKVIPAETENEFWVVRKA